MPSKEINQVLVDLVKKRHILMVLRDAFTRNITNAEILADEYGILPEEIEWFFTEIVQERDVPISRLLPILDKALLGINNKFRELLAENLRGTKIIIFEKWRELIGAQWKGVFRGQEINRIEDTKVIILSDLEHTWSSVRKEKNILIIGLGVYYCKFYLIKRPDPIYFVKPIHGVILPESIYSKALRSSPLIHGKFSDHFRKYLIRIYLDYNLYDPEDSALLKRLYARIIYENLSIFESFLRTIRDEILLEKPSEIEFLSAIPEFFNRILITKEKLEENEEYTQLGVPGLLGYEATIDSLIDSFRIGNLDSILTTLQNKKRKFIKFGWEVLKELMPK